VPGARRLFVPLVFVIGVAAATALGSVGPVGPQVPVNTFVEEFQGGPDIAAQSGGTYVIAWSLQHSTVGSQIRVRRFDAAHAPLTGEVIASTGGTEEELPRISARADGTFVVAWESTTGGGVAAKRFDAAATPVGAQIPVVDAGGGENPDVAVASDGTFVVVWASTSGTRARRFQADGTPFGGSVLVGDGELDAEPAVAIDSAGRVLVVWTDTTAAGGQVYVRLRPYDAALAPAAAATPVIPAPGESQRPDVVATGEGFAVVFDHYLPANIEPNGRRFGPVGAPLADAVVLGPPGGRDTQLARGPSGALIATWINDEDSLIRAFTSAFAPAGDFIVLDDAPDPFVSPYANVAAFDNAAVATFQGYDGSMTERPDIYARRVPYDLSGSATTTTPTTTTTTTPPPVVTASTPAPAPPAVIPTVRPPAVAAVKLPAFATVVTLPSTRRCVSRRRFRIRLRQPKGARIASATVELNRKKAATRRGARITAPIDLRGLPKGRFTVKITLVLADGRKVTGSRRYRTCAPKKR
jgi:hypothetical protein